MRERPYEANVLTAKCQKNPDRTFGIRLEKRKDNIWYCNWAFKISESSAAKEGYNDTVISGKMALDPEYPGCPYCGSETWFQCDKCGKVTCTPEKDGEEGVKCAWCGDVDKVETDNAFEVEGGGF